MKASDYAVFIAVVILGLLIGWYGGVDWMRRDPDNALSLVGILYLAAVATGVKIGIRHS